MRILKYAAEKEGIQLEPTDLLWEALDAKNWTDLAAGFSPMQGHTGRNSRWGEDQISPDDENYGPFV